MKSHGMILTDQHCDYSDLTKYGKITIIRYAEPNRDRVEIQVDGFEFDEAASCRQNVTKAMAWARDVLDAAIRADKLVPGGSIVACSE